MASPSDDTGSTLRIVSPADDHTAREFIDALALASRLGVSRSTLQSWRYAGRGRGSSSSDGWSATGRPTSRRFCWRTRAARSR